MDYREALINAKYHLAVAERMFGNYREFADKRFLVGVINELAKSVSDLRRGVLIREGGEDFFGNVAPKYLDDIMRMNLFKVLEVAKAYRSSPISYDRNGKIILLIDGKYRFLTVERIGEFVKSVRDSLSVFTEKFRQV